MTFATFETFLIYCSLFLATFFEVFLMITLLENNKKLRRENVSMDDEPTVFPTTTIVIPCFNEESTVDGTIQSLLNMDYPHGRFNIIVVDDGSTDKTWQYIQRYSDHPQIKIFQKENGGKYTALNYGIERSKSDLVGCLDADSYVDKETLRRIVRYFKDPTIMAVTPAIKIFKPKNLIQAIQYIEYQLGIMLKKLLSYLNAVHVTPGPFTIFRRDIFKRIGLFRHAHNTEDMEIAMRMHKNHLKIENCHKAFVYTVGPNTLKKLYKQRVRWTHGFLKNAIDYKSLLFKREYGNIAFFTIPFSVASLASVISVVCLTIWSISQRIYEYFLRVAVVGFHPHFHFDFSFIYINTRTSLFVAIVLLSMTMTLLVAGRKISEEKMLSREIIYFLLIYPFIAPLWIGRSVFNTVFSRKSSWR
jgi:cellulose synthase/poly-beta-1,6-N-acetylglucosamine synthase-like glycosyltransferase